MSNENIYQGNLEVSDQRFVLVAGRFNSLIVGHLISGAMDSLERHGAKKNNIDLIYVPGAFEIPLVCQKLAQSKKYDAIIALGAVIRGGTPHFDYVAAECIKGVATVSLDAGIPIGFGVLTVDNIEQAIERAGTKAGNKGEEAAMSVIEMVNLLKQL